MGANFFLRGTRSTSRRVGSDRVGPGPCLTVGGGALMSNEGVVFRYTNLAIAFRFLRGAYNDFYDTLDISHNDWSYIKYEESYMDKLISFHIVCFFGMLAFDRSESSVS